MLKTTTLPCGALLALFVLPSISAAAPQDPEVVEVTWADGSPKETYEIVRDPEGKPVRHGKYEAWHPNGITSAKGEYVDGKREGQWEHRYDNRKRESRGRYLDDLRAGKWILFHANGKKRGEGNYRKGQQVGTWKYWYSDTTVDRVRSGKYGFQVLSYGPDRERGSGPIKDDVPHGRWTYRWPGGQVQFAGAYEFGTRTGTWRFLHADGTPDPRMLSGEYRNGRRAPAATEGADGISDSIEGPTTMADLPERYGLAAAISAYDVDLPVQIEAALGRDEAARDEALDALEGRGRDVLPLVLQRLCALDFAQEEDRRLAAQGLGPILYFACNGRQFDWAPEFLAGDGKYGRLTVLRWLSLWAATRESDEFWELDMGARAFQAPDGDSSRDVIFSPPLEAGGGEGHSILTSPAAHAVYGGRFARDRKKELAPAVTLAREWLLARQEPDGSWRKKPGTTGEAGARDVGLTGLAVLTLLADGNTTNHGSQASAVRRGIAWILGQQAKNGRLGSLRLHDVIYEHAVGTLALCEAAAFSSSPTLRARAQIAVDLVCSARCPKGGWRYDLPRSSDADTSVTCWMVQVLAAAEWAGLEVDEAALAGATTWLDEATGDQLGRIGYDSTGSLSARTPANEEYPREKGEAMTAAGLYARFLLGQTPGTFPIMKRHADLVHRLPPEWDPAGYGCDMYYWFYACQAMHQMGGRYADAWNAAFRRVAVDSQRQDGDEAGSWDSVGPWGYAGGRIYATTMMSLGFLAPRRLARFTGAE